MNSLPQACEILQDQIDEMSQVELQEAREFGLASQHLKQCPQCQAYWQQALALSEKLDQWQVPNPQKNIAAGVMTAIAQLEHDERSSVGVWQRWMRQRLQVPVPVAVVILFALILSVTFHFKPSPSVPQIVPVAVNPSNTNQPAIQPVHTATNVIPNFPSTWAMPSMAPGTYMIILGAPPLKPNDTFFVPQTQKPNHSI